MRFDHISFGHIFEETADVGCYAGEPCGCAGMIGADSPCRCALKNRLSGSLKLEEADWDAVFAITKRRISALPVIYPTAKATTESEALGA